MFWNIFLLEQHKLLKRTLLWAELALLALLVLVLHVALYVTVQWRPAGSEVDPEVIAMVRQSLLWPKALINALDFAAGNGPGGLVVIVLVGAAVAQEYTWRTLHLWLSQGVPRPRLLGAKFAALVVPLLLVVLVPLVAGGAVTAYFTYQQTGGLNLAEVSALHLALSALRTAYTLLPYAALTSLLAVVSRSAVVAIGGGVAYALLVESILVQLLALGSETAARVARLLPGMLAAGLLQLNQTTAEVSVGLNAGPGTRLLDPGPAAVGIALYTLAFFGLAVWVFRRQDLAE
jgi:ABC-type transport system involved in multi-copper enzyme maturation permease subunit